MRTNLARENISQEELDAIEIEFKSYSDYDDRYFLLKFQLVILVGYFYAILLIFFPEIIVEWLKVDDLLYGMASTSVMLMRGVLVTVGISIAIYSYLKDHYVNLVFGSITVTSSFNFISDIPLYYWSRISDDFSSVALILLFRLVVVLSMISLFQNIEKIPKGKRRVLINPIITI